MRTIFWGAAAALALVSAPAMAGTPVSTQPLAAGEVLLEVNALGIDVTRADMATIRVQLSATGDDEAEARRAHAASVRRLTAAARAAGIAAGDIAVSDVTVSDYFDFSAMEASTMEPPTIPMPESSDECVAVETVAQPATSEPMEETAERKTAAATVTVRVRDAARASELREALSGGEGVSSSMPPEYRLSDDRAARRAARADAIANARADAEAYAAAMGMRVVRIVRVSERLGVDLLGLGVTEWAEMPDIFTRFASQSPEVQTFVAIGVDFALAPQ